MEWPIVELSFELAAIHWILPWLCHLLFKKRIRPKLVHGVRKVKAHVGPCLVTNVTWCHWTWLRSQMTHLWARLPTHLPKRPNNMTDTITCRLTTASWTTRTSIGLKWSWPLLVRTYFIPTPKWKPFLASPKKDSIIKWWKIIDLILVVDYKNHGMRLRVNFGIEWGRLLNGK